VVSDAPDRPGTFARPLAAGGGSCDAEPPRRL